MNDNEFLGKGWSFPPEFFNGGAEVEVVSGEEDIRQSLHILLSTHVNERILQSEYGCDIRRFLFESLNQGVISDIQNIVSLAILNHETRVLVNHVELDNSGAEEGLIKIMVDYTVQMTNNRFNLVYPFYINEAMI